MAKRKQKPNGPVIFVRIDEETKQEITEIAKREKTSVNELVVELIKFRIEDTLPEIRNETVQGSN